MKTRLSKKLFETLPVEVVAEIKKIQNNHPSIKSANLEIEDPGHKFYVGEGDYFVGVVGENVNSFQTVSSDTLGGSGMSHKIGAEFQMPEGSWLLRVSYYSGYYLYITQIISGKDEDLEFAGLKENSLIKHWTEKYD